MIVPPLPADERERQLSLLGYRVLDTPNEDAFAAAVRLAAHLFDCPIAALSLVDADRQWFKAAVGLGDVKQTARRVSFCAHAILTPDRPLIVPDARQDPRFEDNPLVIGEPSIRFYIGAPLVSPEGQPLGALCVIGSQPQTPSPEAVIALEQLRSIVMGHLNLRRVLRAQLALTQPPTSH